MNLIKTTHWLKRINYQHEIAKQISRSCLKKKTNNDWTMELNIKMRKIHSCSFNRFIITKEDIEILFFPEYGEI